MTTLDVPARPAVRPAMTALVLAVLLAALDQTIVSTALPRVAGDLGGFRDIAWITASYLLASTAATPLWGKLGDMLGRKRLYLVATTAFLVASALCGLAQDLPQLVAARALQGLAGGGMIVLTFALVGDIVAPEDRGQYQGRFGSVYGVASIAGPLLGGLFTDELSWRWAFLVNVPVGLVAVAIAARHLPAAVRRPAARIDYLGAGLLAATATALILITTFGERWGWASPGILGLAATAVVLIALVIPVERRAVAPVLPLSMLTSRTVVIASVVGFAANVAMFSVLVYLPTYLQVVDGVSATLSGVHTLPLVIGLVVSQSLAGRWIANPAHVRVVLVSGMVLNVAGLVLLSTLAPGTAQFVLVLYFLVTGVGVGMVPMVALTAAQNAVPATDIGAASAVVTFARSIGAAFGVAVFGTLLGGDVVGNIGGAFRWITPLVVLGTLLALLLPRRR
ncbi:MDR family MFS transporter [Amycolatopsis thermoflava]|uniref:MDR family MFS transporter n=1 Tax=Amycolatopsis thermoflava TaxID=84480 RepID=UPI003F49D76F